MNLDPLIAAKILELARWAPSGDNNQPWRFEIIDQTHIRIHGFDFRDAILYDFKGHASHMAHGALLETLQIAASHFGYKAEWFLSPDGDPDRLPVYDVHLSLDPKVIPSPLFPSITTRSVQRRMMKWTPLTLLQKQALVESVGEDFQLQFFESLHDRLQATWVTCNNAEIRLTCPEAYPVHASIVDWHSQFSKDRIPDQALGAPFLFLRMMQWTLRSWKRVQLMNLFFAATIFSRTFLEFLPGISCAAHFLIRPRQPLQSPLDWVKLGAAAQRFWLTATHQGLHMQPQLTPIFFRLYAQANIHFSRELKLFHRSKKISRRFERLAQAGPNDLLGFFGRLGVSAVPRSRSLRKDLQDLMFDEAIKKPL